MVTPTVINPAHTSPTPPISLLFSLSHSRLSRSIMLPSWPHKLFFKRFILFHITTDFHRRIGATSAALFIETEPRYTRRSFTFMWTTRGRCSYFFLLLVFVFLLQHLLLAVSHGRPLTMWEPMVQQSSRVQCPFFVTGTTCVFACMRVCVSVVQSWTQGAGRFQPTIPLDLKPLTADAFFCLLVRGWREIPEVS